MVSYTDSGVELDIGGVLDALVDYVDTVTATYMFTGKVDMDNMYSLRLLAREVHDLYFDQECVVSGRRDRVREDKKNGEKINGRIGHG